MKHVEINLTIFTVIDREVKLLLLKKQTEPYKGYWLIPNIQASHQIPIAESVNQILAKLNLPTVKVLQHKTYSDFEKETCTNTIIISYIGIIDSIRGQVNQGESVFEQEWFNIHKIPKMAYNYEMIIGNNIVYLKELIKKGSVLNFLFPGDFTLPELQKVIEEIKGKRLDRRNFRKKVINSGIVEELEQDYEQQAGRPSKSYGFKETYEDVDIF